MIPDSVSQNSVKWRKQNISKVLSIQNLPVTVAVNWFLVKTLCKPWFIRFLQIQIKQKDIILSKFFLPFSLWSSHSYIYLVNPTVTSRNTSFHNGQGV